MARKKILGLDLGTSSVGWALIELDEEKGDGKVVGIGSRIFEPPVEPKTEEPKNLKRRAKRSMRRLLARRAMRRDTLVRRLVKAGLLPATPQERDALMNAENPYRLRALGLDAPLTLYQFGRTLFHIDERRGFLSNKKSAKGKDKKKESGEILKEISTLGDEITTSGARTLGEYLYRLQRQAEKKRETVRLRDRHTSRKMYETEFEALWNAQQEHHPAVLTDDLKKLIRDTIFFQRPLRLQKGLVGLCTFFQWRAKNPKDGKEFTTGKKRCMRAHPLYQRFRMLQDMNSMRINGESLTPEDRKKLIAKLEKSKELSWEQVRKTLNLPDERDIINLERDSKKLKGLQTIQLLEKIIGKIAWAAMDEKGREGIFEAITTIDDDEENPARVIGLLTTKFGLSREVAEKLANLGLEESYAPLSLKAIKLILPHLESGKVYMAKNEEEGALNAAVKQLKDKGNISVSERHFIAAASKMLGVADIHTGRPKLPSAPLIRNPVVQRALNETRRVVNAIIAKHGVPDEIQVELARDLKLSRERKTDLIKEQNAAGKERDEARKFFEEHGRQPSGDDILKYRLWKELGPKCPYTGKPISGGHLLGTSGEVHIEHIIPFSRSFDDGFNNKTLCFADENRTKGNLTPWEAYGHDEQRWVEIMQNIQSLPKAKRNRFTMKELPQDLPSRYLNDTRYMSREARDYLRIICPIVRATKGGLTAKLRYFWGLNGILREGEENPQNKKNRENHRHHAIDAAVIALTSVGALQRLSRANAIEGRVHADDFQPPWAGFRADVAGKVKTMIVSHRPSRKISGELHKGTYYGKINGSEEKFVSREEVTRLSMDKIKNIRDKTIREIMLRQVERHGGDIEGVLAETISLKGKNDRTIPIKKVRVEEVMKKGSYHIFTDATGKPYCYAPYGNNHHVEIFESPDGNKWEPRFVPTMEAAKRARKLREKSLINRKPDTDKTGWRFVMSLAPNEMVKIGGDIYRVQGLNATETNKNIVFRKHGAAGSGREKGVMLTIRLNPLKKLGCKKIVINILGEERPAHD